MDRRLFLTATLGSLAAARAILPAAARAEPPVTRWKVGSSEGHDAFAFLGPLSGEALYQTYYAADAAAFAPKLPEAIRADISKLWKEAGKDYGLLGPNLSTTLSGADLSTLDAVIANFDDLEGRVRPAYQASPYWDAKDWAWLIANAPRLRAVFAAMRDAGFSAFRAERAAGIEARAAEIARALANYDVIKWQRKLTGRAFEPEISIVLLQFSKPHGIKVQGQTFLQSADYDVALTVRIAAHEMLHPPIPMEGAAARAAMALLEKDAVMMRIVREHDPRWGYTTLKGYLNEDLCQALDQLISEALGVARNPADRWRKADDGMHVLAAGLYALLRADTWIESGGNIEQWLAKAVAEGRLAPRILHPAAARVLERPVDRLWPLG
ncbi:hypothetical protein DAH66_17720 [Sphingomonas koreensis]|uniref:DUF885 domain-containing protein n=1 Tax=Sphingomonas koreensis TaxID=93064 RepID=A0A430FZG3_9SPHN|nr:hypothetical protein [Sphingomonas koreensis]RSY79053.1 hypothetical protein DAH66_17720 [Sphingomonas koreensis]